MTGLTVTIPTLETERLVLRAPRIEDFDPLLAFMATERSIHVGGPLTHPNKLWPRFSNVAGQWVLRGYGSFIIEDKITGDVIGITGAWHPTTWPEREIGWSIWNPDYEGRGIAFEAADAALDYAFGTLGWDTAVSYIDPDNTRSVALAKRLGAVLDPDADQPESDLPPAVVYRHPRRTA